MKITKRQLKQIIREEYSRLKRQGLIFEFDEWRSRNKDIMNQATNLATAKKAKSWWGKDLVLFGAVIELIENIDQVAQDTPATAKAIANKINRDETMRRAWTIAQSMYNDIPGAEAHLEAIKEISSFR